MVTNSLSGELPPEFLKRLKKINRRRMWMVQDLQTNYSRDLASIAHTIQTEIEALYVEFEISGENNDKVEEKGWREQRDENVAKMAGIVEGM